MLIPLKNNQQGMGMVEVLVALLLLAVGVIGFTALQLRAVDATNEALNRVQAMNIARDLAERIRINPYALTVLKANNTAISASSDQSAYVTAVASNRTSTSTYSWSTCYATNSCTSADMATEDVKQVIYKAYQQGMKINLMPCQTSSSTANADGTTTVSAATTANTRQCIYVAWDKTTATDGSAATDCAQYGKYNDDSRCIIMEAY